ncbi:hypothetical protein H8356DRAFT_1280383 [Neocallimastix lanati (nom. inval.)]|nr:hypothetical protein H8356DRAFT_1280383 [Neocallimastix sp. JGI-2020a]
MRPKKVETTPPVCLICVVDISGSMSINCAGNVENMESVHISRLELVKHSLKTIVSTLRKEDMICIIKFDSIAYMQVQPTILANKNIKDEVINNLNEMVDCGCTNIWAGIKMAIDTSASISYKDYQKSIMVFTDGYSNENPPNGVYQTLKETLDKCDDKFTISTFSFGSDVESDLLVDIAKLGNGIYGYCPDGTMVGTIFINYMANLLSSITPIVKVEVNQGEGEVEGVEEKEGEGERERKEKLKKTKIIGPLYRGAYKNAIFEIDSNLLNETKITIELPIEDEDDETIKIEDIDPDALIQENDFKSIEYEENLLNQIVRNKFIMTLKNIIGITNLGNNEDDNEKANNILNNYIEFLNQLKYKTKFIKNLIIDIDNPDPNHGQVMKAIIPNYYETWGKCYLCSFLRFHQFEQCGNFKDQSLQCYSNEVFNVLRKMANTIFINLPPPKTKIIQNQYANRYSGGNLNSNGGNVQMSNFINRYGGCFNGEAIVLLANGKTKFVKDLKKGDQLNNNAIVQCLIEQRSNKYSKAYMCNIDGILFTPYHPICKDDQWYFPIDLVQSKPVSIDSWFNLILNDEINGKYEVEFENGIKAITLGHYRKENKILKHGYFGTDLVLKDLKERDPLGYSKGYIFIEEINYRELQYDENQCCINYYKIQSNNYNNYNNNKIIENENNISKLIY